MSLLEVNKETCTKCGTCAAVCPGGIILFRENRHPRLLPVTEDFCVRCGHCVAVCPTGSLTHADIPLEQCVELKDAQQIDLQQCEQLVKSRRSIRKYRDKEVPRELMKKLIDIARYAPTGHNDQKVRWLVIDGKDKLKQIEAVGLDWMREATNNNPFIAELFSGVLRRMEAGRPDFIRGAPALAVVYGDKGNTLGSVDCTLALGYFDLAANAAGLGCCWAGFFMMAANTFPALKEVVALPEDQQVYGALMVGYPKYKYQRIPVRKTPDITWRS